MTLHRHTPITVLTTATLALLLQAGCSHDNDDDIIDDDPTGGQVAIDSDNLDAVAGASLTTTRLITQLDVNPIIASLGQLAAPGPGPLGANAPGPTLRAANSVSIAGVPCTLSGTLSVEGLVEDATLATLAPGDELTVVFSECELTPGIRLNNTLSIAVQAFSGSLLQPPFSYTVELATTDLSESEATESRSLSGVITLTTSTGDGVLFESTLSTATLAYTESNSTDHGNLTDFISSGTLDRATLAFSQDYHGTMSSALLGGTVRLDTSTPFTGIAPGNPTAGVLVVSGANDSSTTITVIDAENLSLELDLDGDGVADDSHAASWAELLAL